MSDSYSSELEQLKIDNAALRHEFKMLQSGAERQNENLKILDSITKSQAEELREAEARKAVLVEALTEAIKMLEYMKGHATGLFRFEITKTIDKISMPKSEQAKALLAVVEAARIYILLSDEEDFETARENRIKCIDALAAYDKLRGGV